MTVQPIIRPHPTRTWKAVGSPAQLVPGHLARCLAAGGTGHGTKVVPITEVSEPFTQDGVVLVIAYGPQKPCAHWPRRDPCRRCWLEEEES